MAAELRIDVYVDLVCPWCLIGKRNLDAALAAFRQSAPDARVDVQWHSVQLLPDAPEQGWDFDAFYLRRLGSQDAMRQRQAQVNAAAALVDFQFDFSRVTRMPNTLQAHQLLAFARTRLAAAAFAALLEHLFAAHFRHGENLGERATLIRIARDAGLPIDALRDVLDGGHGRPQPQAVPGVPFFVFNQQQALSGAQAPEVLLHAMRVATAVTEVAR